MSKRLIKIIAFLLLIIFWVNFVYPINFVYADTTKSMEETERRNTKKEEQGITPSESFAENKLFTGTTKMKQDREPESVGVGESILMFIPNVFITIGRVIAFVLDLILASFAPKRIVAFPGTEMEDFINQPVYTESFTLDKLFFGDIDLFNANFFDFDETRDDITTLIKINVAKWNVIMSAIALILLLGVMIYLAINMALVYAGVRTPQKHANLKNTMINVLISFVMIFILPIILAVIANVNDVMVRLLSQARVGIINSSEAANFEIYVRYANNHLGSFNSAMTGITYILLIIIYMRFIIVYLKRFYTLGLLTIVSPLITVTYAVDKLKDDKSQILGKFYREYFYAYFLQPLHCIIYLFYLGGVGAIAVTSPLMGLFLLSMFGRVEKIIKGLFDSRDLMVIRSSEEFIKGKKG